MSTGDLLGLLFRWLHLLAAITAVGGTIFVRFVVLPSDGVLQPADRRALHDRMRRRWSRIVMAAIGFLLLSGFYNFFLIRQNYAPLPRTYQMLFGIKFLLALALFAIASLLAGRTALAERLRTQARFWTSLNILLAVLVVCISGVMRTAHPPGPSLLGAATVESAATTESKEK